MHLTRSNIIAFIASSNLEYSQTFYETQLGLKLDKADPFALEFIIDNNRLRVSKIDEHTPASYTVFGWQVTKIESCVQELLNNGINCEQYENMNQNEFGICQFPSGDKVAWFKDPDGNILSLTEFKSSAQPV